MCSLTAGTARRRRSGGLEWSPGARAARSQQKLAVARQIDLSRRRSSGAAFPNGCAFCCCCCAFLFLHPPPPSLLDAYLRWAGSSSRGSVPASAAGCPCAAGLRQQTAAALHLPAAPALLLFFAVALIMLLRLFLIVGDEEAQEQKSEVARATW